MRAVARDPPHRRSNRGLPAALARFSIVQISDLHVELEIKRGYVERIVDAVNDLGAD